MDLLGNKVYCHCSIRGFEFIIGADVLVQTHAGNEHARLVAFVEADKGWYAVVRWWIQASTVPDPKHKRGIRDLEPDVLPTELCYSELMSLVSVETKHTILLRGFRLDLFTGELM